MHWWTSDCWITSSSATGPAYLSRNVGLSDSVDGFGNRERKGKECSDAEEGERH